MGILLFFGGDGLSVVGDGGLAKLFVPKKKKEKIPEKFYKEGPLEQHALRSTIPIKNIKWNEMGGTCGTYGKA